MDGEWEKEQDLIRKQLDEMQEWMRRLGKANQAAPYVRKAYEVKQWQVGVFDSMPEDAVEIPHEDLSNQVFADYEYWNKHLPLIPQIETQPLVTGVASTYSSGSATYQHVARVGDITNPTTQAWAREHTNRYEQMQRQQDRINDVRNMLIKINDARVRDFDEAEKTFKQYLSGLSRRTSVGIAMRNVLEHLKGDLFELAINRPAEQKIRWPDMAARLAKGGSDSYECRLLLAEEPKWRSLHKRLTDVLKDLQAGAATDIRNIFTELVDHIYALLTLIDPEPYRKRQ